MKAPQSGAFYCPEDLARNVSPEIRRVRLVVSYRQPGATPGLKPADNVGDP